MARARGKVHLLQSTNLTTLGALDGALVGLVTGGLAALILGYSKGESTLLVEDYRKRARLARQVMDRVFWDQP